MNPRPDEPAGPPEPGGPDEPAEAAEPTGPEPEPDPDAAFRAIVAGFGRSSESPVPPWPVEEDVDEPRRRASDRDPTSRPPLPPPPPDPPGPGLPGWVEPAALEDGHHYVPPPPPPAPRVRPRTLAAAAAIALGVVLLFAPSLVDVAPGPGTSFLGMLLAGGGAGALVYWMRDAPGPDGPDDGAVV